MIKYRIYAGLSGGFGGATYQGTYEYSTYKEAMRDAYRMAEEEYQSYEGYHGILSYEEVEEDLRESGFIGDDMTDNEIEDCVSSYYLEEIESWIAYGAIIDDESPIEDYLKDCTPQ